jgi:hypothetical protein
VLDQPCHHAAEGHKAQDAGDCTRLQTRQSLSVGWCITASMTRMISNKDSESGKMLTRSKGMHREPSESLKLSQIVTSAWRGRAGKLYHARSQH